MEAEGQGLTRERQGWLVDELCDLFGEPAALRRVVARWPGDPDLVHQVDWTGPMEEAAFQTVQRLEDRGWLNRWAERRLLAAGRRVRRRRWLLRLRFVGLTVAALPAGLAMGEVISGTPGQSVVLGIDEEGAATYLRVRQEDLGEAKPGEADAVARRVHDLVRSELLAGWPSAPARLLVWRDGDGAARLQHLGAGPGWLDDDYTGVRPSRAAPRIRPAEPDLEPATWRVEWFGHADAEVTLDRGGQEQLVVLPLRRLALCVESHGEVADQVAEALVVHLAQEPRVSLRPCEQGIDECPHGDESCDTDYRLVLSSATPPPGLVQRWLSPSSVFCSSSRLSGISGLRIRR